MTTESSQREKAQSSMQQEDKLEWCVSYRWETFPRATWISWQKYF